MPYITVEGGHLTTEQKEKLISGLTEVSMISLSHLKKNDRKNRDVIIGGFEKIIKAAVFFKNNFK